MDFTIEELKNEGRNNIEIIELCDKYLKETNQNIKNLKDMSMLIKENEKFNDNKNEQQNLSNIRTLLIISKKNEETDEETIERLIEEAKEEQEEILKKRQDSIELVGNIIEICAEDLENIYNYKKGIIIERPNNEKQFSSLMNRNSEIHKELKSYEKFGKFLTEKNKKDIENLLKEKIILEIELGKILPDADKEANFIKKREKIKIIASNEEKIKEYENLAEELNDFLQKDKEKQNKNVKIETPEPTENKEAEINQETNIFSEENISQLEKQQIEDKKQIEKKIKRIRTEEEVSARKEKFREKLELMLQNDLNKKNNIRLNVQEYSERTK